MIATMPKPFAVLHIKMAQRHREILREEVIHLQRMVTQYERYFTNEELTELRAALMQARSILSKQL